MFTFLQEVDVTATSGGEGYFVPPTNGISQQQVNNVCAFCKHCVMCISLAVCNAFTTMWNYYTVASSEVILDIYVIY